MRAETVFPLRVKVNEAGGFKQMCDWKRWIWPGIFATLLLGALATWFRSGHVENELSALAGNALSANHPWAQVELDGRDLTLRGSAPSDEAKAEAASIALSAWDVRVVRNEAELLALAEPYKFAALKAADGVTLTGNVPDETTRVEVVAAAQQALPGIAVKDELTLARGAPAGFAGLATYSISQLPRFTTGKVDLTGAALAVEGVTDTAEAYQGATAALTTALPAGLTIASSNIVAPPAPEPAAAPEAAAAAPAAVSPYIWSAEKSADGKVLVDGYAPSQEAADAVVAEAGKLGTVENSLEIAPGAPANYADAANYALKALAGLSSGAASLSDGALSISGETPDLANKLGLDAALPEGAPEGLSVKTKITALPVADYAWKAVKTAEGITLAGNVPSPQAKALNVRKAEAMGLKVTDEQVLANGAPGNFAAVVTTALDALKPLVSGSAAFENKDLAVSGAAPDLGVELAVEGAVKRAGFAADITSPNVSPYVWAAEKTAESVTLSGLAPSPDMKAFIAKRAVSAAPAVVDNTTLANGVPGSYTSAVTDALRALSRLESGTAAYEDGNLTVKGAAASQAIKAEAEGILNARAGNLVSLTTEIIAPADPDPVPAAEPVSTVDYVWQAEKAEAGGITLTGLVPTEGMRGITVDAAGKIGGAPVDDKQTIIAPAPSGFGSAALFGVNALEQLVTGTARYDNGTLTITGETASPGIKAKVEEALSTKKPAFAEVVVNLTAREVKVEVPDLCTDLVKRVIGPRYVNFETNSAVIADKNAGELNEVLFVAQNCPAVRFAVEGHTDSRASESYNMTLSQARADAVRAWMLERGIAGDRFAAIGKGETAPLADNGTPEGMAINRRIEIRLAQ